MQTYELVLDIIPVAESMAFDSPIMANAIFESALCLLKRPDILSLEQTRILLQLSYDLGLIDDSVNRYLEKSLRILANSDWTKGSGI